MIVRICGDIHTFDTHVHSKRRSDFGLQGCRRRMKNQWLCRPGS